MYHAKFGKTNVDIYFQIINTFNRKNPFRKVYRLGNTYNGCVEVIDSEGVLGYATIEECLENCEAEEQFEIYKRNWELMDLKVGYLYYDDEVPAYKNQLEKLRERNTSVCQTWRKTY